MRGISEDFVRAVEQLGHEKKSVRVGGIYGLGKLLRQAAQENSIEEYWSIMDILTSYVREESPRNQKPRSQKPAEDVQAAINVICRRNQHHLPRRTGDSPVDLHDSDLSNVWMSEGHFEEAYFSGCLFHGTDLRGAHLQKADLEGVDLSVASNVEGAKVKDADLTGTILTDQQRKLLDYNEAYIE
jgi:hypothetical protein